MENDESMSLVKYVPSFARGLNLLLVHDNKSSLMHLSSLLEIYSFNVTVINEASMALSMIRNQEGQFKLVMAKVNMPGIDPIAFMNELQEKDIPVIFITSGGFDDETWEALAKGSCYFLEEPIHLKDLKYLWLHIFHPKTSSEKEAENADSENKAHEANGEGNDDDTESKEREISEELESALMNIDSNDHTDTAEETEATTEQKNESTEKKRIVWTPVLHKKFTEAVALLGDFNARPKAILRLMNVPDITTRQVASHLQKYKSQVKQSQVNSDSDLPSRSTNPSFSAMTMYPSPCLSQSYPGLPASTAFMNVNQMQNQFLMNPAENQELDIQKLLKIEGNPSFTYEFPTGAAINESQSLGAVVGNPVLEASADQNEPEIDDDIMKILEDDFGTYNIFGNGIIPDDFDEHSEILKMVLDNSPSQSPGV